MDGHPRYVISKGQSYLYEFEAKNRAGTYWYHPHPHGRTGPQVYKGLAGLFLVSDAEEQSIGLPDGRVFQMEDVADNEIVQLGSKEIWEFNNTGAGMMRNYFVKS